MLPGEETAGAVYSAVQGVPELSRIIRHHQLPVWSVTIIPERDWVVSADIDGHVIASSRETGEAVAHYAHPLEPAITCLLPNREGSSLAVASTGGLFQLDVDTFSARENESDGDHSFVACSRDPTRARLAVANMEGVVMLWDLETDRLTALPYLKDLKANSMTFDPTGQHLALGAKDGTVSFWSLDRGEPLWSAAAAHTGEVLSVDVSPDGRQVVSGGNDGFVRTWALANGSPGLNRLTHPGPAWEVRFSRGHPSGEYIGSVGTDGDIEWSEPASYLPYTPTRAHSGRVNALVFADDGTYATGGNDGAVAYFDPRRPRVIGGRFVTLSGNPWVLALNPAGDRVAVTYGQRGSVDIYDDATLEPLGNGFEAGSLVTAGARHSEGGPVAFGTAEGDILLWSFGAEAVRTRQAHQGAIVDLAYAPDGRSLVSIGADHQLKHWQVDGSTLRDPRVLGETADRAGAVDPMGAWVAFGLLGGGVDVVNIANGEIERELRTETGPAATAIAFASDKPALYIGDAYGRLGLWNTDTWQLRESPNQGHRGEISAIQIDAVGDRVFTAGRDGNVRVWNASTTVAIGVPLTGHGGVIRALAYAPSTQTLVTAGGDGRSIARRLDAALWVAEGCRLFDVFGRRFSDAEIQRVDLEPDSPGPCPDHDPAAPSATNGP